MENNREHYYGLSLKECEELYNMKRQTFIREWRDPLVKMLKKHIVNRIKAIDTRPAEEVLKYRDSWQVDLPFYIPLDDKRGRRQWWGFMETPCEVRSGSVILSRIDPDTEDIIEFEVDDLDKLQILIMWLNRMEFWNDDVKCRFLAE